MKKSFKLNKKTCSLLQSAVVLKCLANQFERDVDMKKVELENDIYEMYYGGRVQDSILQESLSAHSDFTHLLSRDNDGNASSSSDYLNPVFQKTLGTKITALRLQFFAPRLEWLDDKKTKRHNGR